MRGAKFRRQGLEVADQFGTITVDIKKPLRLCVPANKNGEGIVQLQETWTLHVRETGQIETFRYAQPEATGDPPRQSVDRAPERHAARAPP